MLISVVVAGASLSAIMAGAWVWQRLVGNAGWVDVFWTFGTGTAGVFAALSPFLPEDAPAGRRYLVAAMAAAWSFRLGLHLALRAARGPEDARYAAFRAEWGASFQRRIFWFLQIQALAAALLAGAMLLAARNPAPLSPRDWVAVAIMAVAVIGEGTADAQLRRFKARQANRGRVCDIGLWGWSRHPNYFFEWLGWVSYAVMATDMSGTYLIGWLAFAAPAFMYWLLVHVSGIPPLEAQMLKGARAAAYRAYRARTSPFFPLPPRSHAPEHRPAPS